MLESLKVLIILAHIYSSIPAPISSTGIDAYERLEIVFLPKEVIEERVCGGIGNCDGNNIAAYFLGSTRIVVTDTCKKYENNVYCQGVILHEIVHFLQYLNGKYRQSYKGIFSQHLYCKQYINNEAEAYAVQLQFLLDKNVSINWTVNEALQNYSCTISQ